MNACFFKAAVLGLGLALADHLPAQSSPTGTSGAQPSNSTGRTSVPTSNFIDLRNDAAYSLLMSGRGPDLLLLSDLLNYRILAQDGEFGRVIDVAFDRNGNIQYLLGAYQGRTFPLPLTPVAFSRSLNTLNYNVPISTLQQLSIFQQNLPTLQDQAFVQRMQQVFGASFGNIISAYPPGTIGRSRSGLTGIGATSTSGTTAPGVPGMANGSAIGLTTVPSTFAAPIGAGMNNDNWVWPTNSTAVRAGSSNGNISTQPGTLSGGAIGTGTGNNAGIRTNSGTLNSSGGAFGRNPTIGQAGSSSTIRNTGTTAGAGTRGTTAGAGTRGTTAGAGTAGSTQGAGLSGSRPTGTSGSGGTGSNGTTGGSGS